MPPPATPDIKTGIWENTKEILTKLVVPPTTEFARLLPDGIVLGVAVLAMISFSKSYTVLLGSMVELMLVQRLAATAIAGASPILGGPNVKEPVCQSGFMYKNLMRTSLIETLGRPSYFPSPTMFFVSGILSYMVGAVQEFTKEITTLGGDISTRRVLVMSFSIMFLIVLFAFRNVYGCEEFGPLLLSIIFGALAGFIIMQQNKALFGRDSLNLLNLPVIVSALERGKPMFVCGPSN